MLRGMAWLYQDPVLARSSGAQGVHLQTFSKGVGPFFLDAEVPLHLLFCSQETWPTAIDRGRQRC